MAHGGATVAAAAVAVAAAGRPSLVINVPLLLNPLPDKSHALRTVATYAAAPTMGAKMTS
jgi:hypothetical protein